MDPSDFPWLPTSNLPVALEDDRKILTSLLKANVLPLLFFNWMVINPLTRVREMEKSSMWKSTKRLGMNIKNIIRPLAANRPVIMLTISYRVSFEGVTNCGVSVEAGGFASGD